MQVVAMWCTPHPINWIIITFGFNKILKKRLVLVFNRLLADFYRLLSKCIIYVIKTEAIKVQMVPTIRTCY